jgi:hypothetical protein
MKEFVLPSNKPSGIRSIVWECRPYFHTKTDSIKQWVEPESTKALNIEFGMEGVDTRDVDNERAEALIFTSIFVQPESTQPLECTEAVGLLIIFSAQAPQLEFRLWAWEPLAWTSLQLWPR